MRRWIGSVVLVLGVAATGAPAPAEAGTATFVGRVPGSNAYIAVLKEGSRIAGYVCDNGRGSRWIAERRLRAGRAPLVAGISGRRVGSVRIGTRQATGTVEVRGRARRFRASRVRGRDHGIHFAVAKQKNRLLVGGWILHPDGGQRGAVSRLDTESLGALEPVRAPRLDPSSSSIELGGGTDLPPADAEPQELVVIAIIAIIIGLLVPAEQ